MVDGWLVAKWIGYWRCVKHQKGVVVAITPSGDISVVVTGSEAHFRCDCMLSCDTWEKERCFADNLH